MNDKYVNDLSVVKTNMPYYVLNMPYLLSVGFLLGFSYNYDNYLIWGGLIACTHYNNILIDSLRKSGSSYRTKMIKNGQTRSRLRNFDLYNCLYGML